MGDCECQETDPTEDNNEVDVAWYVELDDPLPALTILQPDTSTNHNSQNTWVRGVGVNTSGDIRVAGDDFCGGRVDDPGPGANVRAMPPANRSQTGCTGPSPARRLLCLPNSAAAADGADAASITTMNSSGWDMIHPAPINRTPANCVLCIGPLRRHPPAISAL